MSLEKAIELAKKIDPAIGPSLDIDRKNLSEEELSKRLREFFDAYEKAAEFKLSHPGKSAKELEQIVEENINAHVNNDFHVATFVAGVISKKGDIEELATSAARRVVLSDPRIENFFSKNPKIDKAKISQEIADEVKKILFDYFVQFKGEKFDSETATAELTVAVTKKIAGVLNSKTKIPNLNAN